MNLSQDNLKSALSEHQKQLLNHIIKNGQKQEKNHNIGSQVLLDE